MNRVRLVAAVIGVAFACAAMSEQADIPLQRNPFAAPEELQQPVALAAPRRGAQPEAEPEPQFGLRAVLSAGNDSLANIDGEILAVGEKIGGYRVAAIREHEVILTRGSKRIVLSVFESGEVTAQQ